MHRTLRQYQSWWALRSLRDKQLATTSEKIEHEGPFNPGGYGTLADLRCPHTNGGFNSQGVTVSVNCCV
jgi:hypothetical protein